MTTSTNAARCEACAGHRSVVTRWHLQSYWHPAEPAEVEPCRECLDASGEPTGIAPCDECGAELGEVWADDEWLCVGCRRAIEAA